MGNRIEKKVWPEYFQKIIDGVKTYDYRLGDFSCEVGDILVLKEFEPSSGKYTGRIIEKVVSYVSRTKEQKFFTNEEVDKFGFIIMGFK
ncbi:MAG: DUF3850 domain-containing protein [Nanoarchaeota archaeon]